MLLQLSGTHSCGGGHGFLGVKWYLGLTGLSARDSSMVGGYLQYDGGINHSSLVAVDAGQGEVLSSFTGSCLINLLSIVSLCMQL